MSKLFFSSCSIIREEWYLNWSNFNFVLTLMIGIIRRKWLRVVLYYYSFIQSLIHPFQNTIAILLGVFKLFHSFLFPIQKMDIEWSRLVKSQRLNNRYCWFRYDSGTVVEQVWLILIKRFIVGKEKAKTHHQALAWDVKKVPKPFFHRLLSLFQNVIVPVSATGSILLHPQHVSLFIFVRLDSL